MIIGCFRGCFSLNAETLFEKARLQATYSGDYEPPAEKDIQQILQTLAGNDQETRPDVAFQLIQSKMQYSESKNQWNYLVKNLIILDRCVEDRSFVNDIATIHILHVENYKDPDPRNNIIKIDGFIRKYFQYIKLKSRLYAKKNSSFNVSKSEKRKYFQSLTTDKIFFEMGEAVTLFQFIIELVRTNTDPLKRVSKRGYLEYKLNQYVFHLMLYTMMNLYTTMFSVIAALLERLTDCNLEETNKIKNFYMQFLKNNELFSQFVDDHKFIKGYEEIKPTDFYQPNRNAIIVINDWTSMLESRKHNVDPNAVVIKLDQDFLPKIIIDNLVKYPVKTDNKVNFLGDDENCVYIKQATSELKTGVASAEHDQSFEGGVFRLDKQDSITTGVYPNENDLEKFSIFNSQRLSDETNSRFQFGKNVKVITRILETATTGFCKEFFQIYKNEYSSSFSKSSKYLTQQIYNNKYEKCNLLEQYFEKSFQNTVSFMINDRMTTQLDPSIKELPSFTEQLFMEFKNEYSVLQPMHYTYDDSKIKFQPEQVKQKEIQSQLNVQDVYTIQGADSTQASEFMAAIMAKNESYQEDNLMSSQQSRNTPNKSLNNSSKLDSKPPVSPIKEKEEIQFVPSPAVQQERYESEYKSNQYDYNDEYEIYNKQNNSHQKEYPRYENETNENDDEKQHILSNQLNDDQFNDNSPHKIGNSAYENNSHDQDNHNNKNNNMYNSGNQALESNNSTNYTHQNEYNDNLIGQNYQNQNQVSSATYDNNNSFN